GRDTDDRRQSGLQCRRCRPAGVRGSRFRRKHQSPNGPRYRHRGARIPEDMPFLHRPFMEREVYSAEPGIYIWGVGGFRHDDTVIVGKDKPEVITKRSLELKDQIVDV